MDSRNIVVDHDMAKLKVQAFPAGVRGNKNAGVAGKSFLDPLAFFHVHGSVEADS
jgi:hypothetical protein